MYLIYKLYHPLSNKIYIGKTHDVEHRFSRHLSDKKITKKTSWVKSLKNKYNQIPLLEIIQNNIVKEDWANAYEKSWIEYYRNNYGIDNVLNMTDGGDGQVGLKFSKESKLKMSKSQLGKKLSEITKSKISKFQSGRIKSPETRKKSSLAQLGRKILESTKNKISGSVKKLWSNQEYKNNMSKVHLGIRPSNRKIKDDDVKIIRKMSLNGKSSNLIAKIFNVSPITIQRIINRKYYSVVK